MPHRPPPIATAWHDTSVNQYITQLPCTSNNVSRIHGPNSYSDNRQKYLYHTLFFTPTWIQHECDHNWMACHGETKFLISPFSYKWWTTGFYLSTRSRTKLQLNCSECHSLGSDHNTIQFVQCITIYPDNYHSSCFLVFCYGVVCVDLYKYLTHWGRNEINAILQLTVSNVFCFNVNVLICI